MAFPNGSNDPKQEPRHFNVSPDKKYLKIDLDIELPHGVALQLALIAHQQGRTLNELAVDILESHLKGMDCIHEIVEGNHDDAVCISCGERVEIP